MKRTLAILMVALAATTALAQRGGSNVTTRSIIPECTATTGTCPSEDYVCRDGSTIYVCDNPQTWTVIGDGSNAVHQTGDETIAGTKTFTGSPVFSQSTQVVFGGEAGDTGTTALEWWPFYFYSNATADSAAGVPTTEYLFQFDGSSGTNYHTRWMSDGSTTLLRLEQDGDLLRNDGNYLLHDGDIGSSVQGILTNSAGLAAALSDETGTGAAVFATGGTISPKVINNVYFVNQYATGGTGTAADPWTGWDTALFTHGSDSNSSLGYEVFVFPNNSSDGVGGYYELSTPIAVGGRGALIGSGGWSTHIVASSSFTLGETMIDLSRGFNVFGTRVEELTLDGNDRAGTGISAGVTNGGPEAAGGIDDLSWINGVRIIKTTEHCFDMGTQADMYAMTRTMCLPEPTTASAGFIGYHIRNSGAVLHSLWGISCGHGSGSATKITDGECVRLSGINVNLSGVHVEDFETGVVLGDDSLTSTPALGVTVSNVQASRLTDLVKIIDVSGSINNVATLSGLRCFDCTNTINDLEGDVQITTANYSGPYVTSGTAGAGTYDNYIYGNIVVPDNVQFEGSTHGDTFETTLTPTDPTADRTITLPDATGTTVLDTLAEWKIGGSVTSVRAHDYDADGTLEMTDLQSIITAYGADTELVIPAGSWVAQDNESNSNGVIEVTADNVHIRCEGGAVLNGPKQYFGTHDGAGNAAALSDSTASFGTLTGYTLDNLTDGSSCTVTSNTATTATCTLTGGTDNDWDASDAYSLELDVLAAVYVSGDEFSIDGCEIDGGLPNTDAVTVNLEGVNIQKHGVRLVGTDRFWVTNNYMHDLNHAGVITDAVSNGVISGNYVLRAGRYGSTPAVSTTENGIQLYTEGADSDTRNVIVTNNIIDKFTGNGIALRKAATSDTVRFIVIDGNVIRNQESAAGSCVNPFGGEDVVISNTTAENCRFHITGDTDYLSGGTQTDSVRNVLVSNFNLNNSAWTVSTQDVKIGEYNEGVTILDMRVVSSGNGTCFEYDPPNKDFVVDGLTLIDCAGAGATDGAVVVQNSNGTEDAGVTGREAQWRNITIIDPATAALRNLVATNGWLFENWRVTGHTTVNAGVFRFLTDTTASTRLVFRNIDVETDNTSANVDGITFESADLNDSVFDGITCRDTNGACVKLDNGGTDNYFGNIRAYHLTSGGGAVDDGTATNSRTGDLWCENAASTCARGNAPDRGIIVKASDETVNSTTTLQADDELVVPVDAGKYLIKFYVYGTTTATPDFKFNITCPTQNAAKISNLFYYANAVLVKSEIPKTSCGWTSTDVLSTGGFWVESEAYVDLSAAGNVTFQWAQNTSDAANTTVNAGSYVTWERIE